MAHCNDINPSDVLWFCQPLPESIFDIRVLDDQNNQIQQFEGSEQGTTIQNLEPGIYTVNEIKNPTSDDNQLGQNPEAELVYIRDGFSDAGKLDNTASVTNYSIICFEYEDEQGNDCSTIALATGESRTYTGKNNIRIAFDS